MYGLVNIAVEGLLRERHGDAVWEQIRAEAGVDEEFFIRMESYSDQLTYDLVGAASRRLGVPAEELLFEFGRYWVRFSAIEGYGELLDCAGDSLAEFLGNLDMLHARVGLTYPNLKPPSFRCRQLADGSLELHYHSEREGLAPFVLGLLQGLAERFATPVTVAHRERREHGADHDVFQIYPAR